jgi:hypothetical protein
MRLISKPSKPGEAGTILIFIVMISLLVTMILLAFALISRLNIFLTILLAGGFPSLNIFLALTMFKLGLKRGREENSQSNNN